MSRFPLVTAVVGAMLIGVVSWRLPWPWIMVGALAVLAALVVDLYFMLASVRPAVEDH